MSTLLLPPSHAVRGDSSASKNSAPVEQPAPEESCDATQDGMYVLMFI